MPQLTQLPVVFWSQFFWLAVVFAIIFFVIGRGMVPKIQGTVDLREKHIADDLAAAEAARARADETEAKWRADMDVARAEAARLSNEAKQSSARDTEGKVQSAAEALNRKIDEAEAGIRAALDGARAEIEGVAADAAQDLVARLTGRQVERDAAIAAVKAELNV
jgi:F-type H+-transporting ATPase subunit b